MSRIHTLSLDGQALIDCVVALSQRADRLHNLADDPAVVTEYARRHYREAGKRFERLARYVANELPKDEG